MPPPNQVVQVTGRQWEWRLRYPGDAESLYRRALAIREQMLGAGHPSVAHTLTNIAIAQYAQGRINEAEASYSRALTLLEQSLGASHPAVRPRRGRLRAQRRAGRRLQSTRERGGRGRARP